MSSNLIKIIAAVFVLLAILLAFVGYRMSHEYADNANKATQAAQAQPAAPPQIQVVVATKALMANEPIDAGSLKVVGVEVPPDHYYTKVEEVAGRTPKVDIDTGAPITPRLFGEKDLVAPLVPAGHKAVSLTLNDVIGVGGFVRPGDVVDVLVYLHSDTGNKVDIIQARILLKDALVLASDQRVIEPPEPPAGGDKNQNNQQQRHERTVVVAVPDDDVTRVMLGASLGDVRLALHGQNQGNDQAQAASAPQSGPGPTPVSGGSLPPAAGQVAAAAPAKPGAEAPLPDQPYTSADLARLKPQRPANARGVPQGIVIYHGSKASTVYP